MEVWGGFNDESLDEESIRHACSILIQKTNSVSCLTGECHGRTNQQIDVMNWFMRLSNYTYQWFNDSKSIKNRRNGMLSNMQDSSTSLVTSVTFPCDIVSSSLAGLFPAKYPRQLESCRVSTIGSAINVAVPQKHFLRKWRNRWGKFSSLRKTSCKTEVSSFLVLCQVLGHVALRRVSWTYKNVLRTGVVVK